jgi:hypothetical protein
MLLTDAAEPARTTHAVAGVRTHTHTRTDQGRVVVDAATGELRLLVKMNSQGQTAEEKKRNKAVKDLKQLSGAGLVLSLWGCRGSVRCWQQQRRHCAATHHSAHAAPH